MKSINTALKLTGVVGLVVSLGACVKKKTEEAVIPAVPQVTVTLDGSSTVFPISEAIAEEFKKANQDNVTIGVSGTGGGFKKFCSKEVAMVGASRAITAEEAQACSTNGVNFIELPVAFDGIAIVVNPKNTFAESVTVAELKMLWAPEAQGKVTKWSQVRAGWPDKEIHLFGPGVDSGTYDYFTKAIVGTEHSSRGDFTSSEDDNVLVQGVTADEFSLGFFGLSYFEANKEKLKLVKLDDGVAENGEGPIAPNATTIGDATYQPLSRPIFIYVSSSALTENEAVARFSSFYAQNAGRVAAHVGYVALPTDLAAIVTQRLTDRKIGSLFSAEAAKGTVRSVLEASKLPAAPAAEGAAVPTDAAAPAPTAAPAPAAVPAAPAPAPHGQHPAK